METAEVYQTGGLQANHEMQNLEKQTKTQNRFYRQMIGNSREMIYQNANQQKIVSARRTISARIDRKVHTHGQKVVYQTQMKRLLDERTSNQHFKPDSITQQHIEKQEMQLQPRDMYKNDSSMRKSGSDAFQIITFGSGFDLNLQQAQKVKPQSSKHNNARTFLSKEKASITQNKETAMRQMYNRMQQAKLLSQQDTNQRRPMSMHPSKNQAGALTRLLSFAAPIDQMGGSSGAVGKSEYDFTQIRTNASSTYYSGGLQRLQPPKSAVPLTTYKQVSSKKDTLPYPQQHALAVGATEDVHTNSHSQVSRTDVENLKVKLDRTTKIFYEAPQLREQNIRSKQSLNSGVSPILSEGDFEQELGGSHFSFSQNISNHLLNRPSDIQGEVVVDHLGSGQIVEITDGNSDVIMKVNLKNDTFRPNPQTNQNGESAYPAQRINDKRTNHASKAPQTVVEKEPVISSTLLEKNTKGLSFERHLDNRGRSVITVAKQQGYKTQARGVEECKTRAYKMTTFKEEDLNLLMSKDFRKEIKVLQDLERSKNEKEPKRYKEKIYKFDISLSVKQIRQAQKNKHKDISEQIKMNACKNIGALPKYGSDVEQKGPAKKFTQMHINQLKQHEQGILNLFEGRNELLKYMSHNRINSKTGKADRQYVRLTQQEYRTIFENEPTFDEKKAVVDQFRRKWKEDQGYCSMFDKRKVFKNAKTKSLEAVQSKLKQQVMFRNRQIQMAKSYRAKLELKTENELKQKAEAEEEMQAFREREEKKKRRKMLKALRATEVTVPRNQAKEKDFLMIEKDEKRSGYQSAALEGGFQKRDKSQISDVQVLMEGMQNAKTKSAIFNSNAAKTFYQSDFGGSYAKQLGGSKKDYNSDASHNNIQSKQDHSFEVSGKQAQMHNPLQNNDNEYLSNFITQMYQTTHTQKIEAGTQNHNQLSGATPTNQSGRSPTNMHLQTQNVTSALLSAKTGGLPQNPIKPQSQGDTKSTPTNRAQIKNTPQIQASNLEYQKLQQQAQYPDQYRRGRRNPDSEDNDFQVNEVVADNGQQQQNTTSALNSPRFILNSSAANTVPDEQDPHHPKPLTSDKQMVFEKQTDQYARFQKLKKGSVNVIDTSSGEQQLDSEIKLMTVSAKVKSVRRGAAVDIRQVGQSAEFNHQRNHRQTKTLPANFGHASINGANAQYVLFNVGGIDGFSQPKQSFSPRLFKPAIDKNFHLKKQARPVTTKQIKNQKLDRIDATDHLRREDSHDLLNDLQREGKEEIFYQQLDTRMSPSYPEQEDNSKRISLTKKLAQYVDEQQQIELNQKLRASITDSKLSDEQELILDRSILQPKNAPSKDEDSSQLRHEIANLSEKPKTSARIMSEKEQSTRKNGQSKISHGYKSHNLQIEPHLVGQNVNKKGFLAYKSHTVQENKSGHKRQHIKSQSNLSGKASSHAEKTEKYAIKSSETKTLGLSKKETSTVRGNEDQATNFSKSNKGATSNNFFQTNKDISTINLQSQSNNAHDPEQKLDIGSSNGQLAEVDLREDHKPNHILVSQLIRPSVFNLPSNPMAQRQFKLNFIKSRVEGSRIDYLADNKQVFNAKLVQASQLHDHLYQQREGESVEQYFSDYGQQQKTTTVQPKMKNSYVRHQKLVKQRKKEEQLEYFMKKQGQNKQMMDYLNPQVQSSHHFDFGTLTDSNLQSKTQKYLLDQSASLDKNAQKSSEILTTQGDKASRRGESSQSRKVTSKFVNKKDRVIVNLQEFKLSLPQNKSSSQNLLLPNASLKMYAVDKRGPTSNFKNARLSSTSGSIKALNNRSNEDLTCYENSFDPGSQTNLIPKDLEKSPLLLQQQLSSSTPGASLLVEPRLKHNAKQRQPVKQVYMHVMKYQHTTNETQVTQGNNNNVPRQSNTSANMRKRRSISPAMKNRSASAASTRLGMTAQNARKSSVQDSVELEKTDSQLVDVESPGIIGNKTGNNGTGKRAAFHTGENTVDRPMTEESNQSHREGGDKEREKTSHMTPFVLDQDLKKP